MLARFLLQFLRHPLNTGAIAPSSRALARAMVRGLDLHRASAVVEYGPGGGAFTGEILARLRPGALFVAIENNPAMYAAFRARYGRLNAVNDSAANVGAILASLGASHADCIVSGLPWASFGGRLQDELLAATCAALRDGGRFATFAYLQGLLLPSGRAFARQLAGCFAAVERSPVCWGNLPPAFVYRCVK